MQRHTTPPRTTRIALDLQALEPRVLLSVAFGAAQVIAPAADADSVYAADLDGDGDPDVISASADANTIAWYENLGGGSFGPARTITAASVGARAAYAADLNGDGRPDILSVSNRSEQIAWYENLGGGSFGPKQTIASTLDGAWALDAADLDGDGDLDVLAAAYKTNWYENLGGGTSWVRHAVSSTGGLSVTAADMDGDGAPDLLTTSLEVGDSYDFSDKFVWYANTGGGSFGAKHAISKSGQAFSSTTAGDLNGDGRPDAISLVGSKLEWSQNLGAGVLAPKQAISASASGVDTVAVADLDGDGRADVLVFGGRTVGWYGNLGSGVFGSLEVVAGVGAASARAADLDGDGALDVLAAATGGAVAWYRNLGGSPQPDPGDYVGMVGGSGTGRVYVYDTIGPVDVALADVAVKLDKSGNVASVTIGGSRPLEGLSLVIAGGSPAGLTVSDKRKGAAGNMGFIVCDAPLKGLTLKGGLVGSDVTLPAEGRVALPAGFDASDVAILTNAWLGAAQIGGSVTGDVWIGGSSAAGLAFSSFQIKAGAFEGSLLAHGGGGTFALGGLFRAGSSLEVDGILKSVKITARETDNGGTPFGIFAGGFGKLTVGAWTLSSPNLPFASGDFRVAVH